jgi:hypothetical protein
MSKFRIKLKLTGLELEVEGSKEDMPTLAKSISAQLGGIIVPAANMVEGRSVALLDRDTIDVASQAVSVGAANRQATKRGGRRSTNGSAGESGPTAHFEWQHDSNAWGTPVQTWKGPDKAMWLLYVGAKQGAPTEMTISQISKTFDKLFRSAGKIDKSNLTRDFGKLASQPPAKVSYNGTRDPAAWYLTDTGMKHAESLVSAARGEPAAAA